MPQMAPLNWLSLMMIFISIFIMFNIMNYYSFTMDNSKTIKITKKIKTLMKNWKW